MDVLTFWDRIWLLLRRSAEHRHVALAVLLILTVVSSLQAQDTSGAVITLRWTAPGDDGFVGRASVYDLRISANRITEENWESATQLPGEPSPGTSGTTDSLTIENLQQGITYYVAMKSGDEVPNWSPLSNNALISTPVNLLTSSFSATPDSGEAPLTVQFLDQSLGEPEIWEWDFGDGTTSNLPNPEHTYQQSGQYTLRLKVSNAISAHLLIRSAFIKVTEPEGPSELSVFSESELTERGTVQGSHEATHESDNQFEQLVEVISGGKPDRRHSTLEHYWTVQVPPSSSLSFHLSGYRPSNSEGDDFLFEYSVDGSPFRSLLLVNSDILSGYEAYMPADVYGTVTIRVVDTDHTATRNSLDALFIDRMYIERDRSTVQQDTVFVQNIEVGQAGEKSRNYRATATVTIVNGREFPASGVEVFGHFEGPATGDASGITDSEGRVTLLSDRVRLPEGEWTFNIDSLGANGRVYASGYNLMNSANGQFRFESLPNSIELYPNYPNPFNPSTTISFWLPASGQVRIEVFNLLGQSVEVVLDENRPAGDNSVLWEADQHSSGIYFYRLETGEFTESRKMVLLK
jgi:PKD repeat protein